MFVLFKFGICLVFSVLSIVISSADELEKFESDKWKNIARGVSKGALSKIPQERIDAMQTLLNIGPVDERVIKEEIVNSICRLLLDENKNVALAALDVCYFQEVCLTAYFRKNPGSFLKMETALLKLKQASLIGDEMDEDKLSLGDGAYEKLVHYYFSLLTYETYLKKEGSYAFYLVSLMSSQDGLSRASCMVEGLRSQKNIYVRGLLQTEVFKKGTLEMVKVILDRSHTSLLASDTHFFDQLPIDYRVLLANMPNILRNRKDFKQLSKDYKGVIERLDKNNRIINEMGINVEKLAPIILARRWSVREL